MIIANDLLLVLLTINDFVFSKLTKTTGYWDCCKPSCAWDGRALVSAPVLSCAIDGWTTKGNDEQNGCDGGDAFACNFHTPWAVNDTLSYGFTAAHIQGQHEVNWCCACYELTFTTESVAGKRMILQVINTVGWLDENFFNLQIPGAGVGTFNGCKPQWGASGSGWGERYGGVKSENECQQLPNEIRAGCLWRFSWFKSAKNPFAEFRSVNCPEELLNKTDCQRNVGEQHLNGSTNRTTNFRFPRHDSTLNWPVYVAGVLLAILVLGTIFTFLVHRYRNKHQFFTEPEINAFFKGANDYTTEGFIGENVATTLSYDKIVYEIPPSSFKIDTTKCLGTGEFCKVCMGTVKRDNKEEQVAVKMIKTVSGKGRSLHENKLAIKGLLSEIKLLTYIDKHEHIVALVGAYTEKLRTGHVLLFLELCTNGSLHQHLSELHSTIMMNGNLNAKFIPDLKRWAIQIADGMEFLAMKHLVHADLATRNILLDSSKTAKIADFGLSKRLYNYTNYVKQHNQEPLPWRWMAPESLRKLVFNEKTDVWAFGITLWEAFTLGDLPYPGLNWEGNFPSRLEKGLRLDEPKYNVDGIYMIMLKCWDINPDKRPTFTKLKKLLSYQSTTLEAEEYKSCYLGENSDQGVINLNAHEELYTTLNLT